MATAETETIDAILRGERDRYGELIERHQKMVYGIAWSHLGDASLAEDAAQEAVVKAWMDYNLFLRCATGGLMPVGDVSPPESRPTATSDMRAFARFLGELWLIRDYSVREDRLLMKLPAVRSTVGTMLAGTGISYGSSIVLNADGTCQARMGSADHAAINRVEGRVMDTQDVARTVERTVAHACELFIAGNTDAARSVLCAYSDKDVFKNESDKTKTYRRVAIISIASGIIALIGFLAATARP